MRLHPLGPRPWPVALAGLAFLLGLAVLALALRDGVAYPNELWEPLTLALWPLGVALAARLGSRAAAVALALGYAAQSLAFGFGFGGPHLSFGLPLVLAAVVLLLARPRGRDSGAAA